MHFALLQFSQIISFNRWWDYIFSYCPFTKTYWDILYLQKLSFQMSFSKIKRSQTSLVVEWLNFLNAGDTVFDLWSRKIPCCGQLSQWPQLSNLCPEPMWQPDKSLQQEALRLQQTVAPLDTIRERNLCTAIGASVL